jgi:hypothetical protein
MQTCQSVHIQKWHTRKSAAIQGLIPVVVKIKMPQGSFNARRLPPQLAIVTRPKVWWVGAFRKRHKPDMDANPGGDMTEDT